MKNFSKIIFGDNAPSEHERQITREKVKKAKVNQDWLESQESLCSDDNSAFAHHNWKMSRWIPWPENNLNASKLSLGQEPLVWFLKKFVSFPQMSHFNGWGAKNRIWIDGLVFLYTKRDKQTYQDTRNGSLSARPKILIPLICFQTVGSQDKSILFRNFFLAPP